MWPELSYAGSNIVWVCTLRICLGVDLFIPS